MALMANTWECVIAGGPQHGQVRRLERNVPGPWPQVIASIEGEMCVAAARRHGNNRFIYLHPSATGAQIMTLLKAQSDDMK